VAKLRWKNNERGVMAEKFEKIIRRALCANI